MLSLSKAVNEHITVKKFTRRNNQQYTMPVPEKKHKEHKDHAINLFFGALSAHSTQNTYE